MTKLFVLIIGLLLLMSISVSSQEVVVNDFPIGVGGSIDPDFFKPYYPQLQKIADVLKKDREVIGVIVGTADGGRYKRENDARNPGLALGRAHVLRNLLVDIFKVDPTRLLIQSNDVQNEGGDFRTASVRVEIRPSKEIIIKEIPPAEKPEPVIVEPTTIVNNFLAENMGLRLSAGLSSSPYGVIPVIAGAVSWNNILFIEAEVGHTFWEDTYEYIQEEETLDTKRRKAGAQIIYYPFEEKNLGFIAGWTRVEEVSQQHYQYVKLSEGPIIGVRFLPFENISITGVYNPSKQREAGFDRATSDNDQFILSLTAFFDIGGDK